ncbi:MAG: MarR family transcriptional regulator [Rhizobiaceae bacterium]
MTRDSETVEREALGFNKNLTYRLTRLQNKLNAQAAQILRNHDGPTLTDWRILRILNSLKQSTLAEIVSLTNMDKGQLSRRISALVEQGMIHAQPDVDDFRKQNLTISETGRAAHERVLPAMRARRNHLANEISEEEYATFLSVLDRINTAANNRDF